MNPFDFDPSQADGQLMQMGRRGFLSALAVGLVSLVTKQPAKSGSHLDYIAIPNKPAKQVVYIQWCRAYRLTGSEQGYAEARWKLPGEQVYQKTFTPLTREQPVLWLTKEIGIDYRRLWYDKPPVVMSKNELGEYRFDES